MGRVRGGRGVVMAAAALAGLLAWASAAFACTNLATMTLSSPAGHPGDSITLTGTSFRVPRATSTEPPTPVEIRWNADNGPLLATVTPDRTGSISATFTVPPSEPGHVVIVAVQRRAVVNPDRPEAAPYLQDEPGTPARATFRVLAVGETAPASPIRSVPAATGNENTAMIVLTVLFGTVAMSLFAGCVLAFLHQVRSREMVPAPWHPDRL